MNVCVLFGIWDLGCVVRKCVLHCVVSASSSLLALVAYTTKLLINDVHHRECGGRWCRRAGRAYYHTRTIFLNRV